MTQSCIVCNITDSNRKNYINIFGKDTTLQSKKKLWEVLTDVLEKPVAENTCHSRVMCRRCYANLTEYDSLKVRLKVIQTTLKETFKGSLPQYNLKYESYGQLVNIKSKAPTKIVLPASKLQPIPANYVIDMSKFTTSKPLALAQPITALTQPITALTQPITALTQPITALTQPITALAPPISVDNTSMPGLFKIMVSNPITDQPTNNSPPKYIVTSTNITPAGTNPSLSMPLITPTQSKNPVLSCNITLAKEYMPPSTGSNSLLLKNDVKSEIMEPQPMEIDKECTLAVTIGDNKLLFEADEEKNKPIEPKNSNIFDMSLLLSDSNQDSDKAEKYILDKYTLLDNDEEEEEEEDTIVMTNGDGATIIRMASGQRLLYDGKELSLVQNDGDDMQDNVDGQDSNDESQIELQMSGDEETANAIIAAAQEQGGAIIKVESGEMYRVESIQTEENTDPMPSLQNIVERDRFVFKCMMCANNQSKDGKDQERFVGNAESMMAHLKNAHAARIYICPICDQIMRKRSEYTTHIESHAQKGYMAVNKLKLHDCTICKRKFNSKMLLKEHMNVHTGTRPYVCEICQKTFASKYSHQAHLKTHSARPRPFKCDQCAKTFLTQQNLTQHEKTHLGIKEFICNVCDKAFASQHNLEVHGVIHSGRKPFKCPACSKAFARRAEVRDHLRIHTGERPFACDLCGATFSQRSNLHSHKRATHLDDKRYACTQCAKRFKRRRLLDYHVKAAHTGERPLKCNVCRATFVYPEHYKKHIMIHSGEKPYKCEVCGKSFNSRDNRNTHRFVHSDKKPYECLTCGAGYMRKQLLYQHMNTTGHVAESIVVNQPRVIKTLHNGMVTPLVDVDGTEIGTNSLSDSMFENSDELELDDNPETAVAETGGEAAKLFITEDKKIILQNKNAINIVQDSDESAFLTLHNLSSLVDTTNEKLDVEAQIISTGDNVISGETTEVAGGLRLIRVQLPGGHTGWVALDQQDT